MTVFCTPLLLFICLLWYVQNISMLCAKPDCHQGLFILLIDMNNRTHRPIAERIITPSNNQDGRLLRVISSCQMARDFNRLSIYQIVSNGFGALVFLHAKFGASHYRF